jgi:hypothetical protein
MMNAPPPGRSEALGWAAKFLVTISDRQLIQSIGPPGPIVRARSGEKTLEQI